jgi:hypothetical protein
MTSADLTALLLLAIAAGAAAGFSAASFAYARMYRSLTTATDWGESMADEVQAQPSRYLSEVKEQAHRVSMGLVPIDAIDRAPVTVRDQMRAVGMIDGALREKAAAERATP